MSVITASTRYQTRSILIGAAVLLSLGMGLRQSLGLFLPPVTRDLALTAADFTLAIAVQNVVWGVSQAAVGALADRFGLRLTMMTGALIYVAGLGVLATATGQLSLIVSGAMVGVALSCTASSLVMTAVARSVPEERRSKTLGMVSAAGSLGTLMVPITTQSILASNAWQWGALFFVILAASNAARWVLRRARRPHAGAQRRQDDHAGNAGSGGVPSAVPGHVGRIFRLWLEPGVPDDAFANLSGDLRPGPTAERRSDRGDRRDELHRFADRRVARREIPKAHPARLPLHPSRLRVHCLLHHAADPGEHVGVRRGNGDAMPSVAPLVSGLVAEMFGTRYMATLLGISFVMHQAGSSLGAWGGGLIFTAYGNYDHAWKIGVVIGFSAGVLQILAGGPTLNRDQLGLPRLATG